MTAIVRVFRMLNAFSFKMSNYWDSEFLGYVLVIANYLLASVPLENLYSKNCINKDHIVKNANTSEVV